MKNLIVLFDRESYLKLEKIKEDDKVLRFYYPYIDIFSRENEKEILAKYRKEGYTNIKEIEFFKNEIYNKLYLPLQNIYSRIELELENREIKNIILVGGNNYVDFSVLNFSEGEVCKEFLYKRRWLFNFYVNKKLDSKYKVFFIKKENKIKLEIFKKVRVIIPKLLIKISSIYKKIEWKKNKYPQDKEIVLLSARTNNQLIYMESIYNIIKNNTKYYPVIIIDENYFGNKIILNKKIEYIYLKKINKINSFKKFNLKELKNEELKELKNEIDIYTDVINERLGKLYSLFNIIRSRGNKIISFVNLETHNFRGYIDYEFCKEKKIKLLGFQSVLISKNKVPLFPLTDLFFTWSKIVCKDLKSIYQNSKIKYIGPILYLENYNKYKKRESNKIDICVFTQPDKFTEKYKKLIEFLLEIKKEVDFNLYIKPHPRDKKIQRINFKEKVVLLKKNTRDILLDINLGISLTSTVIQEGFIMGVPMLAYVSEISEDEIKCIDFLNNNAISLVKEKEELKKIIKNYKEWEKKYFEKRLLKIQDELGNLEDSEVIESFKRELYEKD